MTNDLTNGKPFKVLLKFTIPMLLGNVFQQLYNVVDSLVVGKFVGSSALAAVGASFPVLFLAIAVATGLGIGASIVISQSFGAQKFKQMKTAISTSIISILILGSVLSVVGFFGARSILQFINTPADIIDNSVIYLQILALGGLFMFLYNILTSVYNGLGDSKTPLYFLIVATVINIVLDLLFVLKFNMGVSGVAWATLIAQAISAVLSVIVLAVRMKKFKDQENAQIFDFKLLLRMITIAFPAVIQQTAVSIAILSMQNLVNLNGTSFVAGYTAATKIETIAFMPLINLGNAVSSFTAQNVGAGFVDRVKKGYNSAILMSVVLCATMTIILFSFGGQFVNFFIDNSGQIETVQAADGSISEIDQAVVVETGANYLHIVSIFYILTAFMFVANGVLRGSGDMLTFMFSALANLITRIIAAYTLYNFLGASAIWWSLPIGFTIGGIIANARYFSGAWKNKAIFHR